MNCLVLLLLVLCCGNQSNCGCSGNGADSYFRGTNRQERGGYGNNGCGCNVVNDNPCGCSGNVIEPRNNGAGDNNCCSDGRNFIPYPASGGGYEERQNNNGCDCGQ